MTAIELKMFQNLLEANKDYFIYPEYRQHLQAGGEVLRCWKNLENVADIWKIIIGK